MLRKKAGWILIGLVFAVLFPFFSLSFAQEPSASEMKKWEKYTRNLLEERTGKTRDTITATDLKMIDFYIMYGFPFEKNVRIQTMPKYANVRGHVRYAATLRLFEHPLPWKDILSGKAKPGEFMGKSLMNYYHPEPLRGQGMLNWVYVQANDPDPKKYINNATWIYFPDLRRVRRLAVGDTSDLVGGGTETFDDLNIRPLKWEEHKIVGEDTLRPEDYSLTEYGKKYPCKAPYMFKPRRCWVVESKAVIPNYYLSRRIVWYDQELIVRLREEQFDKVGRLLNIFEVGYDWVGEERDKLYYFAFCNHQFTTGLRNYMAIPVEKIHENLPGAGEEWFTPDFMRKEYFWDKEITDQNYLKLPVSEWAPIPKLLRERLPELNRKMELPEELEKKIEEEIERGR